MNLALAEKLDPGNPSVGLAGSESITTLNDGSWGLWDNSSF